MSASGGLTEKEKEARFKALKQGLQDIDDKNINEILLSQNEVINYDLPETNNKIKETQSVDKDNNLNLSPLLPPVKEVNNYDRSKKQTDDKLESEEKETERKRQKLKIAVKRGEPRRRAGKITITDALSGQEARMRSLSSMRRQREKVKIQTESVPQAKQYLSLIHI